MSLEEKVKEVNDLFALLDSEIAAFQSATTLHCKWGCGKCCSFPDIEATVLEFLPFALSLHKQDKAFEWLEKLKGAEDSICLILSPTQGGAGMCSEYPHRGLICRLFGYSARTNKYGKHELVTCQIIKTEQKDAYESAERKTGAGEAVPVMSEYYTRLSSIDPDLASTFYPVNVAIRRAIETTLQYYAYR